MIITETAKPQAACVRNLGARAGKTDPGLNSPEKPNIVEALSRSIYVDDIIAGTDSEDDAFRLYVESKEVLSHGSFNLWKFLWNSGSLYYRIRLMQEKPRCHQKDSARQPIRASEESFSEVTLRVDAISHPGEHEVL